MKTAEADGDFIPNGTQLCDLFSFVAGERLFAVLAAEVEGTAERKRPATLPNAPPPVLGVVCVRGRMLTALDPLATVNQGRCNWPDELPCVVALRGDEQLALAAESFGETITIAAADIEASPNDSADQPRVIAGIARHGGEEITILRTSALFTAAVPRKERRRRRF